MADSFLALLTFFWDCLGLTFLRVSILLKVVSCFGLDLETFLQPVKLLFLVRDLSDCEMEFEFIQYTKKVS